MVNFTRLRLAISISSSASHSSSAIGFSEQHVLAGAQAVARDRVVVRFRRGGDIDHADIVVLDDVLVVERRRRRLGQRLHFGQPVGLDLADMQLVDQRRTRQRFRANPPAPAGADHRRFHRFHVASFLAFDFSGGTLAALCLPVKGGSRVRAAISLSLSPRGRGCPRGGEAERGRVRGQVTSIGPCPLTRLALRYRSALATLSPVGRG